MKSLRLFLAVVVLLCVTLRVASAQSDATNSALDTGLKPYGSYHGGELDSVNLTNGNLTVCNGASRRIVPLRILPSVDVIVALLAFLGLLPVAQGLSGIAPEGQTIIDGLWFMVNLGGVLLLLAGGMKQLLRKIQVNVFVVFFVALIGLLGALRLQPIGFRYLTGGWVLMTFSVAWLLLALRRPRLWAAVGSLWCVLVAGLWSIGEIISFLSNETQRFSLFLPLHIVVFVFVLALLIGHLRYRGIEIGD